jgi:HEAT repeat protein
VTPPVVDPTADGGGYIEKLVEALDNPEPLTRVRAAYLLGRIRNPIAVSALVLRLQTHRDDPEFLAAAATSLGELRDDAAVESLIGLTRQSFLKSRLAAVEALATWAHRTEVRIALRRCRTDPNRIVRRAAARVLGQPLETSD